VRIGELMFGNKKRVEELQQEIAQLRRSIQELGALEHVELQQKLSRLKQEIESSREVLASEADEVSAQVATQRQQVEALRRELVVTNDALILQEVGVYEYRHPLDTAEQYKNELASTREQIKEMVKSKTAVRANQGFTFNNSVAKGRTFVNDFSKLMLRAYNAEAENCVRVLKAGTLSSAEKRLGKTAEVIARLGRLMDIQISPEYHTLRLRELSLTADYLSKQQEEKEAARAERERLREEEKARAEYRREQERLLKEKTHYLNALEALQATGNQKGIAELNQKIEDVDNAIEGIKSREANIRAGYVYVISNIGSFGERMVKIGMTRRLDPMDRVRELGDASVPFRYDIHALFFSEDAVGIEAKLHRELEQSRVNRVNLRREFFYATPSEVKEMLLNHAGNLLDYAEVPEALEYWQSRGSDGDVKPLERAVVT
jgi:hypothetical protein